MTPLHPSRVFWPRGELYTNDPSYHQDPGLSRRVVPASPVVTKSKERPRRRLEEGTYEVTET